MTYRAVYRREPDGRWIVEMPQVKGCHSYGRTIDQARDRDLDEFPDIVGGHDIVLPPREPVVVPAAAGDGDVVAAPESEE